MDFPRACKLYNFFYSLRLMSENGADNTFPSGEGVGRLPCKLQEIYKQITA
jgi:hypothetical protein